jgi:subtilisin family serine protease
MNHARVAVAVVLTAAMLVAPTPPASGSARLTPPMRARLATAGPEERIAVIAWMRVRADLSDVPLAPPSDRLTAVVRELDRTASGAQADLLEWLEANRAAGRIREVTRLWAVDAIAFAAMPSAIRAVAARPDVAAVTLDVAIAAPSDPARSVPASSADPVEPNLSRVQAPRLWNLNVLGEGTVVASMDTGVDALHPDLSSTFRGGAHSWFDPAREHGFPTDVDGHGTGTMGVMVGGRASGTSIGVAPDARWIAAKIFDDRGVATESDIHESFQWLLDPDGDPSTPDGADVVNASWVVTGGGCDLTFAPDVAALRAGGIPVVFAAGNAGPNPGSDRSPANNPGALAIGAVDHLDRVLSDSSRGPSSCVGAGAFPDLVAPGAGIRTTDLADGYARLSGTSVAAPHVAGAIALLRSAFPSRPLEQLERALARTALDVDRAGIDDATGAGRLRVYAAYRWLTARSGHPTYGFSTARASRRDPLARIEPADALTLRGSEIGLLFDASDVGIDEANLDALAIDGEGDLLLSFDRELEIPGAGSIDDADVVMFRPASLGASTSGRFLPMLDGSDVGLRASTEDVDGVEILENGRLLVSTLGAAVVPGAAVRRHDLLAFAPSRLGADSEGTWSVAFRGASAGLNLPSEAVDAVAVDGGLVISTVGAFSSNGAKGSEADVVRCSPWGTDGPCVLEPLVDGEAEGLGAAGVDAFEVLL